VQTGWIVTDVSYFPHFAKYPLPLYPRNSSYVITTLILLFSFKILQCDLNLQFINTSAPAFQVKNKALEQEIIKSEIVHVNILHREQGSAYVL
jgi:hypothetical protein